MELQNQNMEELIFGYIDRVKAVMSTDLWENILLNSTKNEVFILLQLYRYGQVNMTWIAEYINVPLNTATGIVDRMEKRGWVRRERSPEDKRVVTIVIAEKGKEHMNRVIRELVKYGTEILGCLSEAEMALLNELFDRIISVLENVKQEEENPKKAKKVRKIVIE